MGKIEIIMRKAEKDQVAETVLVAFDEKEAVVSQPDILAFPNLEIRMKERAVYKDISAAKRGDKGNGTAIGLYHCWALCRCRS